MDGYGHENPEKLEPRIRAMMAGQELPPWMTGYDVEFGAYPVGDEPAVWINLQVPADLKVDQALARQYIATVIRLRQDFADVAPGYQPLFRLAMPSMAPA